MLGEKTGESYMANPRTKQDKLAHRRVKFATACESIAYDVSSAILGFIPNGLNLTYDRVLKPMPVLGRFFSHRWVEQVCKLCTGTTIGQGVATDLAHFLFRPIGFAIGVILAKFSKKELRYEGQFGKFLFSISEQTVGGALLGIILISLASLFVEHPSFQLGQELIALGAGLGASLGLLARVFLLVAINQVNHTHMEAVKQNAQRAKELGMKLKKAARQKAKSLILREAQDIIQQMNGSTSQQYLETFFNQTYDMLSNSLNQKIDRHFNYLVDRACHGDIHALKRLQDLIPTKQSAKSVVMTPFEVMIDRIFNTRAIFRLKDEVDTAYDRWQYDFLRVKTS